MRLRRINRICTIHGSLAIEGNTLSEAQITAILEGKRVIAPPREVQEVKNALADGLIEMTTPDKPNSRMQKYRLTLKGRQTTAGASAPA
ncbi:MAG: Fic family protein [Ectothiorhodospira sp.]